MATKKITLNELRSIVKQIIKEESMLVNENMLSSKYHMEVFDISDFIEKNKMDIAKTYSEKSNENIWKIIAYLYQKYKRQY